MLAENVRRARDMAPDFYSLTHLANLFTRHGQERALLWALRRAAVLPLAGKRILEVGCGDGQWLSVFEDFGARQSDLSGIELDGARIAVARARYAQADLLVGDAAALPWADGTFDLVWQSTVFTSILDDLTRRSVARDMLRVLRPGGAMVWYDFAYDNPRNPHVRGIGRAALADLFPNSVVSRRRVTLAPPLARRLVPISWSLARGLEAIRLLNTHIIAVVRPL